MISIEKYKVLPFLAKRLNSSLKYSGLFIDPFRNFLNGTKLFSRKAWIEINSNLMVIVADGVRLPSFPTFP